MFRNRLEAARLLSEELISYKGKNAVIIAIPRGGLPVAGVLAQQLNLPLEVVLIKKIGHPSNKEYAIGAVSLTNIILDEQAADIPMNYISDETHRLRTILTKRLKQYYGNRKPREIKDKIAIIVDDGIATGNTILATAQLVREESPSKIIVAVPVAPRSTILKLSSSLFIDEVICLKQPTVFHAVGEFYEDFDQVSDEEAIKLFEMYNNSESI